MITTKTYIAGIEIELTLWGLTTGYYDYIWTVGPQEDGRTPLAAAAQVQQWLKHQPNRGGWVMHRLCQQLDWQHYMHRCTTTHHSLMPGNSWTRGVDLVHDHDGCCGRKCLDHLEWQREMEHFDRNGAFGYWIGEDARPLAPGAEPYAIDADRV